MEEEFISRARARQGLQTSGGKRMLVLAIALSFLLGAGIAGYLALSGKIDALIGRQPGASQQGVLAPLAQTARPSGAPLAPDTGITAEAVEKVAQQQGGLESRVVAMEQRIDQLNLQTQAATGNAARAEALLIAFATRRAIERGAPLGYLSDQLKLRFGDAHPNAVQTIIDAAQKPVTLDQLVARLEGLAPTLTDQTKEQLSWNWFKRQLGELFVVRRETAPSPQPTRRLDRARLFLETGRIEAAVAEVRNLPRADEASQWIADAERYAAVERALDLLETTAVLEPRDLRDANGKKVEQRSPASESAG